MGNAELADVFISYTGRDWGGASWLDFVLREAGYTTKVQGYDFMVGRSFVLAMDEALKHSRLVACLLSPSYLESRWCGEEWQVALLKENLFPLRTRIGMVFQEGALFDSLTVRNNVAYQLIQAGAEVAAVVEAGPRIGGYQVHASKLRRAGVPISAV